MHWADVLAEELLERGSRHTLATGITPSGPIHVGNLREVMTTEAVHRAVQDAGGDSTLLYIGDTYDPLRKVYPFLEDHPEIDYDEHVGKPLSAVPAPDGEHESYAHAFLAPFLDALDELGIDPEVRLAHELYESGAYSDSILNALDEAPAIRRILEEESGRDLPDRWIPFNVRCQVCGRLSTTEPLLYEFPQIEYRCDCGHEGGVDPREGGAGKLPWRVDWPARWAFLGVTFEAFGKDHAASGGSWDTAVPIAEEVYRIEPPHHAVYEWVHGPEGALSGRKGSMSARDVLEVTPPEALRFFFLRYQPSKQIEFDPEGGMLDLVDEHDEALSDWATEGTSDEIKDVERVLELAQPTGQLPEHPGQSVSMQHLATLVQIYQGTDEVLDSVQRSGHIDALSETEEALLRTRIEHTRRWVQTCAPEHLRFEIPDEVPHGTLQDVHRERVATLVELLETRDWEADALQDAVYAAADKLDIGPGGVFKAAYLALLGQSGGPRLGPFLAGLERDWALTRLREAAQGPTG